MAWTFDRATLEAERDEAREDAERGRGRIAFERLARAHLWLDEIEEARRWFAAAVAEYRASGALDRGGARDWECYGALLRHAGQPDQAREALARSLERLDSADEQDRRRAAGLRVLLGRDPADLGDPPDAAEAIDRARRDGDTTALAPARRRLVTQIAGQRWMPSDTEVGLTFYDWLEETFRAEADVTGAPLPDHGTMLARAGLLAGEPGGPAEPPAPGRWTVSRVTPDGVDVDATLTASEHEHVTACLDPSRPRPLWLELFTRQGAWATRLRLGPASLLENWELASYGDALVAARDMLVAATPDPPGATWALATLDELLRRAAGTP